MNNIAKYKIPKVINQKVGDQEIIMVIVMIKMLRRAIIQILEGNRSIKQIMKNMRDVKTPKKMFRI